MSVMSKHYEVRLTLENKQVIHGPIIPEEDYADWYAVFKEYPDGGTIRLKDLDRSFIIPNDAAVKGWLEFRQISIRRRLLRWLWRSITR